MPIVPTRTIDICCSCLILPPRIENKCVPSIPYNIVCLPRDSSYLSLFLRTRVSVMSRVNTLQTLGRLMHVQMNQPARTSRLCGNLRTHTQAAVARVVDYPSAGWVALRWGAGTGRLPNSIYPPANEEGGSAWFVMKNRKGRSWLSDDREILPCELADSLVCWKGLASWRKGCRRDTLPLLIRGDKYRK